MCITVVGNDLWSGSDDHTIKVWDVTHANECKATLTGHSKSITALQSLTRTAAPQSSRRLSVVTGPETASLPTETVIVSSSVDATLKVWNTATLQCVGNGASGKEAVHAMELVNGGDVWCGGQRGSLEVRDVQSSTLSVKHKDPSAHAK